MDSLFDGFVPEFSVLELCSVEDEDFDSGELDSLVLEELDDSDSEGLDVPGVLKSSLGGLFTWTFGCFTGL